MVKQYGNNILKQLDIWANHKVISGAEKLSDALKGIDNRLSSSARNFTLNMGLEPQLVSGARITGGQFDNITSKLDNFVQAGRGQMDELLESTKRFSLNNMDSVKIKHWVDNADDIVRDGSHMDGNVLKPNVVYEAGEHKYLYKTDELGRIEKAYADDLQLKLHDGRLKHNPNSLDKLEGDHSGHIFGDLFGGSPELDNLVSQARDVNLKEYRRIERKWENALKSTPPKKVEVDIKINYEGNSMRPSSFNVTYSIDGKEYKEIIKNVNR